MYIDRKKAWLGAAIGAVGGIVGGIINKNKQKRALRRQQYEQNRNTAIQNANAIEEAYNNQDYINEYNDRLAFAYGGKRKKCTNGAEVKINEQTGDVVKDVNTSATSSNITSGLAEGIGSGINSISNALFANHDVVTKPVVSNFTTKTKNTPIVNGNIDIYSDRLNSPTYLRCGGKRMKNR